MKNIHILPTPNPGYLYKMSDGSLNISDLFEGGNSAWKNQNIYITSDEEIKEGDWFLSKEGIVHNNWGWNFGDKKIILTTDQDLTKDGVQAINDEFLEWFVKNPSCEEVDVWINKFYGNKKEMLFNVYGKYKIIIPKEEPKQDKIMERFIANAKQETLEEAAERWVFDTNGHKWSNNDDTAGDNYASFKRGAKWQQERSYSEEEVLDILKELEIECVINPRRTEIREWFEQFKKK